MGSTSIFTLYLCLFICCFGISLSYGQSGNKKATEVKGIVMDSLHNYVISLASVSLYAKGSDRIAKLSISGEDGSFSLKGIAPNTIFRMVIAHQNYTSEEREFILKEGETIDFKKINLPFKDNILDAVEILSPVRLNGDTIEFNADAFSLDTNAVVEDLLNKLPGVLIWGDGKVTMNGREIKSVLVNGKPFFGSYHQIATQNIAKDAVDKIQVYDARPQEEKRQSPEETNEEMNIVLKKGKDSGYFGKLGGGLGTKERNEGDLSLNYFNPKTQATGVFSSNNVNKRMYSTSQLLKNSTFKGVGIQSDFNSDFRNAGITQQNVGGVSMQHDFLNTVSTTNRNMLKFDYLNFNEGKVYTDESESILLSGEVSDQPSQNSRNKQVQTIGSLNRNHLNASYQYKDKGIDVEVSPSFSHNQNNNNDEGISRYTYSGNESEDRYMNESQSLNQEFSVSTKIYNTQYVKVKDINWLDKLKFDLSYHYKWNESQNNINKFSNYKNFSDPARDREVLRIYDTFQRSNNHQVSFGLKDLLTSFLSNGSTRRSDVSFYNTVSLHQRNNDNKVWNTNENQSNEVVNDNLTFDADYHRVDYQPNLQIRRNVFKDDLYGRYSRNIDISIDLSGRIYSERNRSSLDYRNISRHYRDFNPGATLSYANIITSTYVKVLSISFRRNKVYPSLEQLVPVYDDINTTYRFFGNPDLQNVLKYVYSANYLLRQNKQFGWSINADLNATKSENDIIDSVVYNSDGYQEVHLMNTKKDRLQWSSIVSIEKPYKISQDQTVSFNFSWNNSLGNRFQYIGHDEESFRDFRHQNSLNIYYTYLDKLKVGLLNSWSYYERNNLVSDKNDFSSSNISSKISVSYALSKRLSVNSNADLYFLRTTYYNNDYLIWNTNAQYRMLKGNNLELKISVLDLLNQNKGIYYESGISEVTTGVRNNLSQYFSFSLSYYPRRFGLKGK